MTNKKTTWNNEEIKERLMKEAKSWMKEMDAIIDTVGHKDWDAYKVYYANAMQTLECIRILTDEGYFIDTDAWGHSYIYRWPVEIE